MPNDPIADTTPIYGTEWNLKINRPLIFVPGILGSRLIDTTTGKSLWPNINANSKGEITLGDPSLSKLPRNPGRECNLDPTGSNKDLLFPESYTQLLNFIELVLKYKPGHDYWVFAYDWTQSNKVSGTLLAAFAKQKLEQFNRSHGTTAEEVDFIAHSMGNFVVRAACVLNGANANRYVSICQPAFGAPKALFVLHFKIPFKVVSGWFSELVANFVWRNYVRQNDDEDDLGKEIQIVAAQLDSIYELLPDAHGLSTNPVIHVENDPLTPDLWLKTPEESYIEPPHKGVRRPDPLRFPSHAFKRIREAMEFKRSLGIAMPGKNTMGIYSSDQRTEDFIEYDDWREDPPWNASEWDSPDASSDENGDGTVPAWSATVGSEQAKVPGTHSGVPNSIMAHRRILSFFLRT